MLSAAIADTDDADRLPLAGPHQEEGPRQTPLAVPLARRRPRRHPRPPPRPERRACRTRTPLRPRPRPRPQRQGQRQGAKSHQAPPSQTLKKSQARHPALPIAPARNSLPPPLRRRRPQRRLTQATACQTSLSNWPGRCERDAEFATSCQRRRRRPRQRCHVSQSPELARFAGTDLQRRNGFGAIGGFTRGEPVR